MGWLHRMLKQIIERYDEDTFLIADGFDDAVIGVAEGEGDSNVDNVGMKLIYSVSKCLNILEKEMTESEAIDYFIFNVSNAYVGCQTPIWCWDNF